MNAIRHWLGRPSVVLAFTILYITSQVMIGRILHGGDAAPLLFQFQFSYNAAAFQELLNSISSAQLQALQQHFVIDHIHPLWYSVLAFSLTAWLLNLNQLSSRWNLALYPAFVLGLADVLENSIHEPWFQLQAAPSDPLVLIAGTAATLKWSLAALYLLGALALTLRFHLKVKAG